MSRALALCASLTVFVAMALGQGQGIVPWVERKKPRPDLLKKVEFEQKLNAQVPLELMFVDETGRNVPLGSFFREKPVVLSLVYYECPMLCTLALNGELRAFRALDYTAGNQFEAVTVSINPLETPVIAAAKKASYLSSYGRSGAGRGWHFLTGAEPSIRALAQAVGLHYEYDPVSKQYAHATALMVLTPQGRIARYQYGVEYSASDLRTALIGASQSRIGGPVEKFLLYCFHYDPATGKYSVAILDVIRVGAIATCAALLGFVVFASRKRLRRPRAEGRA